jgi:hypothetical protein
MVLTVPKYVFRSTLNLINSARDDNWSPTNWYFSHIVLDIVYSQNVKYLDEIIIMIIILKQTLNYLNNNICMFVVFTVSTINTH